MADNTVANASGEGSPAPESISMLLDVAQLSRLARKGALRAAAFLGYGLRATEGRIPETLALTNESMWSFFPEPVPEAVGREVAEEYRFWLIGNALRELDQHFSIFLDTVWAMQEWSKLHGTTVSSSHAVNSISTETNVAKKFRQVMIELGEADPKASYLWSLSNARNCLAHNAGIVAQRHVSRDGALSVKWLGLETRLQQGEWSIVIPVIIDGGLQAPDPTQPSTVVGVTVEREKRFAVGEKLEFTPGELHEICFYYLRIGDEVLGKFQEALAIRGIGLNTSNTQSL